LDNAGKKEFFFCAAQANHRLSIIDSAGLSPMNNYRLAVCGCSCRFRGKCAVLERKGKAGLEKPHVCRCR